MPHIALQITTPNGGFTFPLGPQPLTIGRSPDNQIHFDDKLLDDYHCVLMLIGGRVHAIDRGTASGTLINGKPVKVQSMNVDDELRAGSIHVTIISGAVQRPALPGTPGPPALKITPMISDEEAQEDPYHPKMPQMPVVQASKLRRTVTGKDDSGAPIKVVPDEQLDRPPMSAAPKLLGELLLPRDMDAQIRGFLRRHAGAMVICGPAGSGKSTTAYALLRLLAAGKRKITTFEQPPEFPLEEATQIFVHDAAEYGPEVERALRTQPNVLMLGEPPTRAAASVAFRAAIGRCLVIAISNSSDSVNAIFDLLDLGILPKHLIASLSMVVAQRQVRRLCDQCKTPAPIPDEHTPNLAPFLTHIDHIYTADACPICNNTGYVGHIGVFEILHMTDELRAAILARPGMDDLYAAAHDPKTYIPLKLSTYARVAQGFTSIEQAVELVKTLPSRDHTPTRETKTS